MNKIRNLSVVSQCSEGLELYNYWDRLKLMRFSSVQRRMERYRVIYIWKVINLLVPNFGLTWDTNVRRGRIVIIPPSKSAHTARARALREQSLAVHGGRIFNLLPVELRNWTGSKDGFKTKLDAFLGNIPDQPACSRLTPAPTNSVTCKSSNSLTDWIPHLKLSDRRPGIVDPPLHSAGS